MTGLNFLRSLADRGLRGVKQETADDHKGLRAAARVFNTTYHSCRIHWMRNALAHAPRKQRMAVAAMLKTIFAQETRANAEARWEAVADALRDKPPRLGALMDSSRHDVLASMSFPREHWVQIASTNPPERVTREIRRRADVVGILPHDDAIIRRVGALMLETNDEWAVARRLHEPGNARPHHRRSHQQAAYRDRLMRLDLSEGRRPCTTPWDMTTLVKRSAISRSYAWRRNQPMTIWSGNRASPASLESASSCSAPQRTRRILLPDWTDATGCRIHQRPGGGRQPPSI